MRTLLVDNVDSYTYNLYQLIWQTYGMQPLVVRNDDPRLLSGAFLTGFDAVVISPGPGDPARGADVGLVPALLERWRGPVLGVCLGHQLLGLLAGGRVERAPWPEHGKVERVFHDGSPLFAGIPSPFEGVRYHSLHVVGGDARRLAWSADDVTQALEVPGRPWWGVQFHPESVASSHGAELLRNFRALVLGGDGGGAVAARPGDEGADWAEVAPSADDLQPLIDPAPAPAVELAAVEVALAASAEDLFDALARPGDDVVWLDSSSLEHDTARFSYLCWGERVDIDRGGASSELAAFASRFESRAVAGADAVPFGFHGGYVGWFGYEADRPMSAGPQANLSRWLEVRRFVAIDHRAARAWVVTVGDEADAGGREAWTSGIVARIAATRPGAPRVEEPVDEVDVDALVDLGPDAYVATAERAQEYLRAGESYEICLTTGIRLPQTEPGRDFYRRLRALNPAPFAAYAAIDGIEVMSSSPELFLSIDGAGRAVARPMKGTAPRSADPDADAAAALALAHDPKTIAENLMIADLLRNDLGVLAARGSVRVPELMRVEAYATAHQMVSVVEADVASSASAMAVVAACFPPGSMTGAPKRRTVELLDGLEARPRGVYSGVLGHVGFDGAVCLNVLIRTAVVVGGVVSVGAGGAVVLASSPRAEYDEMALKLRAVLRAYRG
ncbi:MAG: chorismate-binding protein [Microbacteriaceae bacterium]|nr:chorismate-binding protein [Microbacteriaceae bacterium]MCL2795744.1 chorismate-binding protein [Microbacteriaceae bacterium]